MDHRGPQERLTKDKEQRKRYDIMTTKKTTAIAKAPSLDELYPVLANGPEVVTGILASLAENLGGERISTFDLDRIKVPSGDTAFWTVPSEDDPEGTAEKEFEAIVVGQILNRSYWASGIDESGGGSPPDCSSPDGIAGFGTPGGTCAECTLAQWGSAGRGQACKTTRNMFILLPNLALPVVLTIPPSSLGDAKKFLLRLASRGKSTTNTAVVFGLKKVQNADGINYSRVTFMAGSEIPKDMKPSVKAYTEQFGASIK